jgi:TonB family protein
VIFGLRAVVRARLALATLAVIAFYFPLFASASETNSSAALEAGSTSSLTRDDIRKGFSDYASRVVEILLDIGIPEFRQSTITYVMYDVPPGGQAQIQFEISSDGRLLGEKILRSSGRPFVDRAVFHVVKIATYPPFNSHMPFSSCRFEITVSSSGAELRGSF